MRIRVAFLVLALLSLLSILAGGYVYYNTAKQAALKEAEGEFSARTRLFQERIQELISFHHKELHALSSFEDLREALVNRNEKTLMEANRVLDHFAEGLNFAVFYLLDGSGNAMASSNRNTPEGFVGHNYSFRPYFMRAIEGKPYTHMALGVTTHRMGLYLSSPVYAPGQNEPVGVIAAKVSLDNLEDELVPFPGTIVLLVHDSGIITLSMGRDWLLHSLWKIPDRESSAIAQTRQFGSGPWTWTGVEKTGPNRAIDGSGEHYALNERTIENCPGWRIVCLRSLYTLFPKTLTPLVGKTGLAALGLLLLLGSSVTFLFFMAERDLKARQNAEQGLVESERRYRSLVEDSFEGIFVQEGTKIVFANSRLYEMLGYEGGELEGKEHWVVYNPAYQDLTRERAQARMRGEDVPSRYEVILQRKDGSSFEGEITARALSLKGVAGIQVWVRDISERKQAEKSLRESEARYRELFEHSSDLTYTQNLEGYYTSVNHIVQPLLGYSIEEFLTLHFRDILDPSFLEITEQNYLRKVRDGVETTGPYEILARTKDGTPVWLEVKSRLIIRDGKPEGIHGTARDISERKGLEAAIQESHSKYQSVVNSFDGLIYICSQDYEIEFANQRLVERTGYDPVGQKCFEALHQREDICPWCVNERVLRGETVRWEIVSPKDNRWYHIVNSPIRHEDGTVSKLALIQDITERRQAEEEKENLREQLFQAQKMEAIGTLSGGIAHDFNNLLQAISGYSELLLMNPKLEEKTLTGLNRIYQAARNGATLVKGLLTLSGRIESQRKPMNVNHQVDEVVNLLSRTIPKVIELEEYLDDALPLINGDPVQVHQVLMNLGINARDAMPDGGRLVFETSKVNLDETYCKTHVEAEPGIYVLLSVSDTGTGMDQETAAHIFEPFFTTKPVGAGSGLGLSIVYGIVKQHGGTIRCYSKPGRGTTFKVYFPIIEETVELSEEASREPSPSGGTETLLLVDDDEVVRELAESLLVEMGYTVLTASNGKDAVKRYRIDREKISLVILDLIMPEMDGERCLEEILKIAPGAKVLVASGYSENGPTKKTLDKGAKGFVHKPYEVRQLLQKVREVLDQE